MAPARRLGRIVNVRFTKSDLDSPFPGDYTQGLLDAKVPWKRCTGDVIILTPDEVAKVINAED